MAEKVERIYGGFRGVDFRGDDVNLSRSPDAKNMWKDYRETESIRTRPATEYVSYGGPAVYGIYFYKGELVAHVGNQLIGNKGIILSGMNSQPSKGFIFNDKLYIKDGKNYIFYDGSGNAKDVCEEAYVPTTSIARKPGGGGTQYEDVNLISHYRKNSFLSDGKSTAYLLDAMSIDEVTEVKVNGLKIDASQYTVNLSLGKVTFNTAPTVPKTDGQDNVEITFKKVVSGNRSRILKCTLLQVFDNRVFFSGNPDYPNYVWHCSLDDPSYCSDTDYYREGLDTAKVTGLVAGNNALWVFRESSDANTTVFYHTPTLDDQYGKIYPAVHSSITTGCIGAAINFNDDIVFFSERGMEGISGDVTTEQVVAHRSAMVDRKMIAEQNYKNMVLAEWDGYLFVFIGKHAYLADSRAMFTNVNHYEYEWFYWELDEEVRCACVNDDVLYLGTSTGVYKLVDKESNVESYWVTPKDKFNQPHMLKTTNKRGCVAEAKGDISVYAKLEDTDFELIGEYKNVTDYFVSRIKRKKFKDIQLKFYSSTRFSLETITLEAYLGGYIKR